ncbi:MAG: hypothetical protein ACI4J3_08460 [Oscillospiraceae bacterium]
MAVSPYQRRKTVLTLQDHIATQGILVVSAALIFVVLQCLVPEYAGGILLQWQRLEHLTPTVQQLWQMIAAWFA